MTCLLSGEETGGDYALLVSTAPPGDAGPPPHRHTREDETFYVLEGEVTFWDGEQTVVAGPGVAAHMPRDRWHTYRNDGDETARFLILARPAGIEQFFAGLDAITRAPGGPDMAAVVAACEAQGIELRLPD